MNRRDMLKAVAIAPFMGVIGNIRQHPASAENVTQVWDIREMCHSSYEGIFGEHREFALLDGYDSSYYTLHFVVDDIPSDCSLEGYEAFKNIDVKDFEDAIDADGGLELFIFNKKAEMVADWHNTYHKYVTTAYEKAVDTYLEENSEVAYNRMCYEFFKL